MTVTAKYQRHGTESRLLINQVVRSPSRRITHVCGAAAQPEVTWGDAGDAGHGWGSWEAGKLGCCAAFSQGSGPGPADDYWLWLVLWLTICGAIHTFPPKWVGEQLTIPEAAPRNHGQWRACAIIIINAHNNHS